MASRFKMLQNELSQNSLRSPYQHWDTAVLSSCSKASIIPKCWFKTQQLHVWASSLAVHMGKQQQRTQGLGLLPPQGRPRDALNCCLLTLASSSPGRCGHVGEEQCMRTRCISLLLSPALSFDIYLFQRIHYHHPQGRNGLLSMTASSPPPPFTLSWRIRPQPHTTWPASFLLSCQQVCCHHTYQRICCLGLKLVSKCKVTSTY